MKAEVHEILRRQLCDAINTMLKTPIFCFLPCLYDIRLASMLGKNLRLMLSG